MAVSAKTAIITGACSGIGLAVTRHLLAKSDTTWHVVLVDIREHAFDAIKGSLDSRRTTFVRADISQWEDNARMFKIAYYGNDGSTNSPRKIDFFFANAGTGDKELISQSFDLDAEPLRPDITCLDVQVGGVLFGLKLFIHYTRKAQRDVVKDRDSFKPKMVITSSCTAQYPFPVAPQYAAGKAALLSLTRSVGLNLLVSDNIAVNCIMPAYVATNITPPGLNEAWPKHWITPTATMARAVDELIDPEGKVVQDGKSDGKNGVVKTAESVECVVDRLCYRRPVEYVDESQRYLIEESIKPDGIWWTHIERAMKEMGGVGISR